jgi:catechol 2,3-dioxygenase-like lactoylglutathione lyase family enzyme
VVVDRKLEVIVIPVADVDRAKGFYEAIGFHEDFDVSSGQDYRVVRFTPPGSAASIMFGEGITAAAPGSVEGLVLLVADISIARADLIERGVDVTGVFHDLGGVFYHLDPAFEIPGPDPARRDHRTFARFVDPDGNQWVLQEVRDREPHP